MTLFPVIQRELRAESRRPFTYWMRTLSAAAVVLLCGYVYLAKSYVPESQLGGILFNTLHVTLFFTIWIAVPMMTADCLSRERREGTLGLLFLTPLRATDIVMAKGFAHGLRATMLCVAVLPVVCIPMLMGGVNLNQALLSFAFDLSSLFCALAAGLIASAGNKSWNRALVSSVIWSCFFLGLFWIVIDISASSSYSSGGLEGRLAWGMRATLNFQSVMRYWQYTGSGSVTSAIISPVNSKILLLGINSLIFSIVLLTISVLFAARCVRRNWQELPPSPFQLWWQRTCCTPVVMVSLLKRWMRRTLDRNPVGWLELRSWTGRTVMWSWFAVIISLYTMAFTSADLFARSVGNIQTMMGWLLAGSMMVAASGSFRRERETGVLELLLVTPIGVREIINGRVRGIWSQFLPAMALLLGIWFYWISLFPNSGSIEEIFFFAATFLSLPVIGLYFSLASRTFIGALIWTILVGVVLPLVLGPLTFWVVTPPTVFGDFKYLSMSSAVCQMLFAGLLWWCLHVGLRERKFNLERTVS